MLQKYFPILGEVNSPLAALAALQFTPEAAEIVINNGISNQVLESLLWGEISSTVTYRKEVEISTSELEKTRVAASKAVRAARYRAACAARSARSVSRNARHVKAIRRPITGKATLRGLSGLSIEACRAKAAASQSAVRSAVNTFNAAHEAVQVAIQGGDVRAIRTCIAALKEATRLLEVRHLELRFAREMVSISLARHSA